MLNLKVERMEEWWPCLARVPAMNVVDASELRGEQCECRGCMRGVSAFVLYWPD